MTYFYTQECLLLMLHSVSVPYGKKVGLSERGGSMKIIFLPVHRNWREASAILILLVEASCRHIFAQIFPSLFFSSPWRFHGCFPGQSIFFWRCCFDAPVCVQLLLPVCSFWCIIRRTPDLLMKCPSMLLFMKCSCRTEIDYVDE